MSEPLLSPLQCYRKMYQIRAFENLMEVESKAGRLPGTFHSSVGQEAVAVGVCSMLRNEDRVVSNHRGHGHFIAKGGDLFKIMAELYGRPDGYAGGKGGTQHMAGPEVGFMGSNGITGGGIAVATGLALSARQLSEDRIVVDFFGDGAANQGTFHESLNMAALWKLPIVYICENNGWGMSTPVQEVTAGPSIAARGNAYGIPNFIVDGNDLIAIQRQFAIALGLIRNGHGPVLIEARTWRIRGHSRSDDNRYRDKSQEESWSRKDPLVQYEALLLQDQICSADELNTLRAEVEGELEALRDRCRTLPPAEPASAFQGVYAGDCTTLPDPSQTVQPDDRFEQKPYWQAIQEALAEALERDPRYFLFGEDIAEYGGCFKVTRGMLERFGKQRLINTPISEASIAGLSVGAAMGGARPIAEIMFMDFILLSLDQLLNHAAKFHYIYNGLLKVPLVLRTPMGGYRGYGATHSQCLDTLLAHLPGIRVVTPWSPRDAKGLLATCLAGDDPAIFIEHKALYGTVGSVPVNSERIPLGKAAIVRPGRDITLCANSYMVSLSLQAAALLAQEGIEAEVIDLRSLAPLDRSTVAESAARTQALVTVEESHYTFGWGAEIAASVQELAFGYLDAPILRVAAADVPIPNATDLERVILPSVEKIVTTTKQALSFRG